VSDLTPPKCFTGTWTILHESGRIAEETEYQGGELNGKWTTRYDNHENTLKSEGYWKNGRRVGNWKSWYDNEVHQVRSTSSWKNGLPDGPSIDWHPNGVTKAKRFYENGISIRDHTRWDEEGNLESVAHHDRRKLTTVEHFEQGTLKQVDIYDGDDLVKVQRIEGGRVVRETDPRSKPELNCTLRVVGIYPISPTLASISKAAKYHHLSWLLDDDGRYKEPIPQENRRNLRLVEIQIEGDFVPHDLMRAILLDRQAPYMEFYLDPQGESLLSEEAAVATANRRVCFFLHFVASGKPFEIAGRSMSLPSESKLPNRLVDYTHYVPVD
jgi:antitoxin component YwqK of YwqJK toxin-antitoxin module